MNELLHMVKQGIINKNALINELSFAAMGMYCYQPFDSLSVQKSVKRYLIRR